jgi:hypothetical protein
LRGPDQDRGSRRRGKAFFVVQPETAGARVSGSGPSALCVFDTWLGDDLVRVHPAILVTTPLRDALAVQNLTGFAVSRARVSSSSFWRRYNRRRRLPVFWYLLAQGVPGLDDVGFTADVTVVISWRVLEVLVGFEVGRAVFAKYSPTA